MDERELEQGHLEWREVREEGLLKQQLQGC